MLARFRAWLQQPFSAGQSATAWFLFIGLIICIVIIWAHIMRYITDDLT